MEQYPVDDGTLLNEDGEGQALSSSSAKAMQDFSVSGALSVPHNLEAEQTLLGALLADNGLIEKLDDSFDADCFYAPVHARIYDAIVMFHRKGLAANPVTLKYKFEQDKSLAAEGGAVYLAKLTSLSVGAVNLVSYAHILYDLKLRRELLRISGEMRDKAYSDDESSPATQQIEGAEQELFQLADRGTGQRSFVALKESLTEAVERAELAHKRDTALSGIHTGFTDLNTYLGGLQNSDLVILAGRPSMGKTALAINVALEACRALYDETKPDEMPRAVGFFSLEMSSEQLAGRMIAMESGVNSSGMRSGTLPDEEFGKIVEANRSLYHLPFFIDDTPALSISAVRTRCRRLKRRFNLGLLFVDYLQLLKGSSKSSEANRVQEVSEITQGLKAIAKELNIPVVALSQLSRSVEQRPDKRPQLSDLRESGSIEQDADIVLFIYREEYYVEREQPSESDSERYSKWQEQLDACRETAEVIIAKHRHGPIGTVKLRYISSTTKFANFGEPERYPEFMG